MKILARAVGRRKEAVAQVQLLQGEGRFLINQKPAESYLQFNNFSILKLKAPFELLTTDFNAQKLSRQTENLTVKTNLNKTSIETKQEVKITNTENGEKLQLEKKITFTQNLKLDIIVKVKGGGVIGQVDAIKLALTRALCKLDEKELTLLSPSVNKQPRKIFKLKGFLTQDSRIKERRKYGLKKARKAPQYSKR